MKRRETGILGEKLARDYLKKQGYRILETNYNCPHGEIDIIAKQRDTVAFIEVRTKTSSQFGTPEESITQAKKERMKASALHYLQTHRNLSQSWRIDFVAVELTPAGRLLRIEIIKNAVGDE